MNKKLFFGGLFFGLIFLNVIYGSFRNYAVNEQQTDETVFEVIMQNIRSTQWQNELTDLTQMEHDAEGLLEDIQPDGSFDDINYNSTSQTSWEPLTHLRRLKVMALVVSYNGSRLYNNQTLCEAVDRGLQYWYDQDPRSSNWYNQQISSPKLVGEILILMRVTDLPVRQLLEEALLTRMQSIGGTPSNSYSVSGSSNKINIACHWIYRGCLDQNTSVLSRGVDSALSPVRIQPPSLGIQMDGSYQEHGKQLYIANYGTHFIDNVSNIACYLVGTDYQMPTDKLDVLSDYCRHAFMQSMRGNYSSFSVTGRQIGVEGRLRTENGVILKRMKLIDPDNALVYDTAIRRLEERELPSYGVHPMHSHYWLSDYSTHIRPSYSFDVRTVSVNTLRTENVNSENLKGHFLSDGATNIVVEGDEYFDIFPAWDWARVPGTTTPHISNLPNLSTNRVAGESRFTGGVSDSLYGVSVYDMNDARFHTSAKKSWFFFDDEVVCLGAGIYSTDTGRVGTTVNQTLQKGEVTIKGSSTQTLSFGTEDYAAEAVDWVLHGNIGYVFPSEQQVHVSSKEQEGNWYAIARSQVDETVSKDVFTLWLDHGKSPSGEKYAYIVVPHMQSAAQLDQYTSKNDIVIVANDETLQSVYHRGLERFGVVFYQADAAFVTDSFRIWTSKPCVLMFTRNAEGEITGHIADPSRTQGSIRIYASGIGDDPELIKYSSVSLPTGSLSGSSLPFSVGKGDRIFITGTPLSTSLLPLEDTYVSQGTTAAEKAKNFGLSPELAVKKNGTSTMNNREAYLKFSLDTVSIDPAAISSVELRMVVKGVSDGTDTYNWVVKAVAEDGWAAGTGDIHGTAVNSSDPLGGLNWTNSRSIQSTAGINLSSNAGNQPPGSELYFDVTDAFLQELASDKVLSLLLTEDRGGDKTFSRFYSLECDTAEYRPTLVIHYQQIETYDYKVGATEDGYVDQANATRNFGKSQKLVVKKNPTASVNNREAYLKFDLTDLPLDPAYIRQIKLQMYVNTVNPDGIPNYNWIVKRLPDDNWTAGDQDGAVPGPAGGITWNNTRGLSASATTVMGSALGAQPAGSLVEFDITDPALEELEGDKILSMLISSNIGDNKGDASFYSIEGPTEFQPQLVITTFEDFADQSLPVRLVSFTADVQGDRHVRLRWVTAITGEDQLVKTNIMSSVDGEHFTRIASVPAAGELGSGGRQFQYLDTRPLDGHNYYQLELVDGRGESLYSDIRQVNIRRSATATLKVYPNPVAMGGQLRIVSETSSQLHLYNNLGVFIKMIEVRAGSLSVLSVQGLVPGLYHLKSPATGESVKFLVK